MALDLKLKTLGVWESYITELVHESLKVSQTGDGLNSTCSFDLIDRDVIGKDFWTVGVTRVEDGDVITDHVAFAQPKVEVRVTDGATVYFAGTLVRAGYEHFGDQDMVLRCECQDFNQLLEESVIDDFELYGASSDEDIINDLFPKYVTDVGFAAHVTGPFVSAEISFDGITVRRALDTLAAKSNYKWYVGYDKELYYDAAGADAPAWHLSDNPDNVNSFSFFDDISMELDSANLINMVFVIGGEVGLWFQDAASIAQYGEHKAIIRDSGLIDIDDIEDKGNAILESHKDPIATYTVKTYKDGLRAGMNIRLVCALYDIDDTYLISSLTISFPVDGAPVYEISCGGLKSSTGAAASRLALDTLQDPTVIPLASLPLASKGWGHDLTFTSTDHEKVAWAGGTITAAGGRTFAINAGDTDNPGAMVAKTIVYLDTSVSITDLQVTTVETAAFGINKIPVAVCWPGIPAAAPQPEVLAGFQVFGSTTEVATFLNATNIIANAITASEIYVSQLSAIVADMGVLTAGQINIQDPLGGGRVVINNAGISLYDNVPNLLIHLDADGGTFMLKSAPAGDRVELDTSGLRFYDGANLLIDLNATNATFTLKSGVVGSARIEISNSEIVGKDAANDEQFKLEAATGKATCGAGAVTLHDDGIDIDMGADLKNRISFDHAGTERGYVWPKAYAGGTHLAIATGPPSSAAHFANMTINSIPNAGAGRQTGIDITSEFGAFVGYIGFHADGVTSMTLRDEGPRIGIGKHLEFDFDTHYLYKSGNDIYWKPGGGAAVKLN